MFMKLPNKKNLIFLAIVIVILIFVFIYVNKNSVPPKQNIQNKEILNEIQKMTLTLAGKDSDNDGLKDWEEFLWKTDLNNPDTDNDGTVDGEEIRLERNPIKSGPNDKLEEFKPTTTTSVKKSEDLTVTDKFSQEFFARYIELKRSGKGTISEQDQADLVNLLAEKKYFSVPSKIYTKKDLKILNNVSTTTLHSYGNNIAKIIVENNPGQIDNEFLILEKALRSNNPNEVKKYDKIIKYYKQIIDGFRGIPVSEDVSGSHIEMLNNLSSIMSNIEAMKKVFDDPVFATSNITGFINNFRAFTVTWTNLQDYFQSQNIVFNKDEYGYIFVRGI